MFLYLLNNVKLVCFFCCVKLKNEVPLFVTAELFWLIFSTFTIWCLAWLTLTFHFCLVGQFLYIFIFDDLIVWYLPLGWRRLAAGRWWSFPVDCVGPEHAAPPGRRVWRDGVSVTGISVQHWHHCQLRLTSQRQVRRHGFVEFLWLGSSQQHFWKLVNWEMP